MMILWTEKIPLIGNFFFGHTCQCSLLFSGSAQKSRLAGYEDQMGAGNGTQESHVQGICFTCYALLQSITETLNQFLIRYKLLYLYVKHK